MKEFLEKLFDLLYDYIDYIIMLAIIIVVVAIIGWRLDLIFTDDGTSNVPPVEENLEDKDENEDEEEEENKNETENDENPLDEEEPANEDEGDDEDVDDTSEEPDDSPTQVGGDIEIDIPSGTLPSGIGNILLENQLIDSNEDFINTVLEQNLETGLKAGLYTIPSGSSIDEILAILTN